MVLKNPLCQSRFGLQDGPASRDMGVCSKRRQVVDSISGGTLMNPHRLLPVLLAFTFAVPSIHAQVRPQARTDSLLKAASKALDHYHQLAAAINCEDATEKTLRDSCKGVLEMLGRDVQDAKEKIASYRQLSTPQPVDLFDIYQVFQEIMAKIDSLGYAGELYGERNRGLFAETYNNFVKITGWFGSEVRNTMQSAEKRSARGHS